MRCDGKYHRDKSRAEVENPKTTNNPWNCIPIATPHASM